MTAAIMMDIKTFELVKRSPKLMMTILKSVRVVHQYLCSIDRN